MQAQKGIKPQTGKQLNIELGPEPEQEIIPGTAYGYGTGRRALPPPKTP